MTKNFIQAANIIFCPDDVLYIIQYDEKRWNNLQTEMIWYSRIRFNSGEGIIFEEQYFDDVAKKLTKNKITKNDTNKE